MTATAAPPVASSRVASSPPASSPAAPKIAATKIPGLVDAYLHVLSAERGASAIRCCAMLSWLRTYC